MSRNLKRGAAAALALVALVLAAARAPAAVETAPSTAAAKESYKLPISPPLDQGDSDLCWVYATLSMLESNYREKHPRSNIELSRAALQRDSIADRFEREIAGSPA